MKTFLQVACDQALSKFSTSNPAYNIEYPNPQVITAIELGRFSKIATTRFGDFLLYAFFKPHHKHSFFTIGCGWHQSATEPSPIPPLFVDSLHSELLFPSGYIQDVGEIAPFLFVELPNHTRGGYMWMPHFPLNKQNKIPPIQESYPIEESIENSKPNYTPALMSNLDEITNSASHFASLIIIPYFEIFKKLHANCRES